jgi:hypothetical protein
VRLVSVGWVDVCDSLESSLRWRCRGQRLDGRHLGVAVAVDELIAEIRALGDDSDDVLRALLRAADRQGYAVEIVIVALLPLALSRCRHSRDRVDELIGELAIVIAEAAREGLPASRRRVANILLDRAWGRAREPARRVREPVVMDGLDLGWRLVDRSPDPADVAVDRVMLDGLAERLRARASSHASVVRAWNVAVSLADAEERSSSDRIRLKYARQVLRRSFAAEQVA